MRYGGREAAPSVKQQSNYFYIAFLFFSVTYPAIITIFGWPTYFYSRHGFYKYVLLSFFHLFLRKSFEKGAKK